MANLGVVYSISSGVVTRLINPDANDGDAYLDKVQAGLDPRLGLYRIPKSDVGGDDKHCPAQEILIAYINNSKAPPKTPLQVSIPIAILDANSTVVEIVQGCPDLIATSFVPEKRGPQFSSVEASADKAPTQDVTMNVPNKGAQLVTVKIPIEVGSTYNVGSGKFVASADQVAAVDAMVATANTAVSADGTVIAADPVVVKP